MYDYIINMWQLGLITTDDLTHFVIDGWITQDESNTIQASEQIEGIQ